MNRIAKVMFEQLNILFWLSAEKIKVCFTTVLNIQTDLFDSRKIWSAVYCYQIFPVPLYVNSIRQNSLSLAVWSKDLVTFKNSSGSVRPPGRPMFGPGHLVRSHNLVKLGQIRIKEFHQTSHDIESISPQIS